MKVRDIVVKCGQVNIPAKSGYVTCKEEVLQLVEQEGWGDPPKADKLSTTHGSGIIGLVNSALALRTRAAVRAAATGEVSKTKSRQHTCVWLALNDQLRLVEWQGLVAQDEKNAALGTKTKSADKFLDSVYEQNKPAIDEVMS